MKKNRFLASVIAIIMVISMMPTAALADAVECTAGDACTTHVAAIGTTHYDTLSEAIAAAASGQTVKLLNDISGITTADIVTVPAGITLTLDMNGKSITVASDFAGRPIVNNGNLTVTGNGTIDSSDSEFGGYGAINNFGTLTIENGTFKGHVSANGSAFYNRPGATATIEDGYFEGTRAVSNDGVLTVNNGTFYTTSCNQTTDSSGNKVQYAYCFISSGTLYFNNGKVTGVQGGLGINNGYAEVKGGEFETVACEHSNTGAYSFYALYIAGEEGAVEAHIYGGTYTSVYRVAILCGNDNTNGDGGINAKATAQIHGGQFIGGTSVNGRAMDAGANTGDPCITGGTFSSDVSAYVPTGYECVGADSNYKVEQVTGKLVANSTTGTDGTVSAEVGGVYCGAQEDSDEELDVSSDSVVVDITSTDAGTAATSANVTITSTAAASLGNVPVTVKTDPAEVTLDIKAMSNVAAAAEKADAPVELVVEKKPESEIPAAAAAAYSVELKIKGENILPEKTESANGNITVTIPYTADADVTPLVYYVNNGIPVKQMDSTYAEGKITFTTNHLSDYAVYTNEPTATPAAKRGDTYYSTLQEAIDASDSDTTIILQKEVIEVVTVGSDKTITIDLAGYTLKNNATAQDKTSTETKNHTITNSGNLTVTDSVGGGTVDNVSHGKGAIYNNADATCTIKGGTFTRSAEAGSSPTDSGNNSWYVIKNDGTMTFDGGTVTANGSYSSLVRNDGTMTINDGLFKNCFIAIKNDRGDLAIHGGTIESKDQAVQNWNTAAIDGGDLTGAVYSWSCSYTENGTTVNSVGKMTISGDTKITGNVYAVQYKGSESQGYVEPNSSAEVEIKGGTVIGKVASKESGYGTATPTTPATVKVEAGDFSQRVDEKYLADDLNAELYSKQKNPDAPYSYYSDESAAMTAAKTANVTDAEIRTLIVGGSATMVTVRFNANGGTVNVTTMTVESGKTAPLPTPNARADYSFAGWWTAASGGTRYTSDTAIGTDVTLYAHWTYTGGDSPSGGSSSSNGSSGGGSSSSASSGYPVSVSSAKNGTVTASPKSANKGATVTLTVKPSSGYELESLTVTDKDGRSVKLAKKSDTKYTFTMPASKVTVEAAFAKTVETPERRFTDVPDGHWAETEINWAAEKGYINGNTATTYNPEAPVTRQQLWTILARLSGQRPADFVEARAWAVENGISDGTNPGVSVSRQQLVTILHRWAQKMGYSVSGDADLTVYPDHASVAAYAEVPMSWSVANSIVGGTAQGTLNPAGATTRAQFAVILYRFWGNIVNA